MYKQINKHVKKEDCDFYHTIELPNETITGNWDLTKCVNDYLGRVDYKNKRVIDVGTASGFLSFSMEKKGAEVVSYDMPNSAYWDQLKYAGYKKHKWDGKPGSIENSYHYCHTKLNSKCKLFHANIYDELPDELGRFDGAVFGTMLSHVRDPMLVLMNFLMRTDEFAVLINPFPTKGETHFMPNSKTWEEMQNGRRFPQVWWWITMPTIRNMVECIGWKIDYVIDIENLSNRANLNGYKALVLKKR
jgi:SAM-dependent methyltransferase